MSVIEKLDSVLALVTRKFDMPIRWSDNGNIVPVVYADDCEIAAVYSDREDDRCPDKAAAIIAAVNYLRDHGPAIRQGMIDAERYAWLRDSQNCSLSIAHNDHHNMYLSVADTLDEPQGYYSDLSDAERAHMIATDTIWTVHVYPNTPVGFNVYHASTLDAAIDKARATGEGEGHD